MGMNLFFKEFYVLLLLAFAMSSQAADPDPVKDFSMNGNPDLIGALQQQFTLHEVFKNGDVSHGPGGLRAALNTNVFPAMDSQGLTYVHFRMKPCGVNLPHTHPRATEMLTMVQGGPLQVGFVDTEGKAHIDILHAGDVTIFPRGMMHFELNVGVEPAFYISALNSQNPGTLTSGGALFNLPARALASALNQELSTVKRVKDTIYEYSPQLQLASRSTCIPGRDINTDF